ncbi:hypothetical protein HK405_009350, partial [Cladochytrium tenue]
LPPPPPPRYLPLPYAVATAAARRPRRRPLTVLAALAATALVLAAASAAMFLLSSSSSSYSPGESYSWPHDDTAVPVGALDATPAPAAEGAKILNAAATPEDSVEDSVSKPVNDHLEAQNRPELPYTDDEDTPGAKAEVTEAAGAAVGAVKDGGPDLAGAQALASEGVSTHTAMPSGTPRFPYEDDEAPPSPLTAEQRQRLRATARGGRIGYLNRHGGTRQNMRWIMRELGLNISHVNPDDLGFKYGMSGEQAAAHREAGTIASLCAQFDVLIVGDTIPDARGVLEAIRDEDPWCAATHLVLEITNRFDFGVSDGNEYRAALNALYERDSTRLHTVANNAFEVYFAFIRGVRFRRWRVLRPSGYSDVPALPDIDTTAFAFKDVKPRLQRVFEEYNIRVKSLDLGYGGPHTLARYRAFVESPYQVSTMKLYENLAAGVVVVLPTPRLWREINMFDVQEYSLCWTDVRHLPLTDYPHFIDYYHRDLSSAMVYFDSFDELRQMVAAGDTWVDTTARRARAEGPRVMARMREEALAGWQDVLVAAGALVVVTED